MAHDLPPIAVYRRIAIGLLASVAVVLLTILYIAMVRATITVVLRKQSFPISHTFTVGEKVTPANGKVTAIAGVVTVVEQSSSRDISVSTLRFEEGKAEGVVRITNRYSRNQPLIATTRLLSSDGVLFRTTETVSVPVGGSIDVHVVADKLGASGDIGPATFILPGLWAGIQDKITGTSSEPMHGGKRAVSEISEGQKKEVEQEEATKLKDVVLAAERQKKTDDHEVVIAALQSVQSSSKALNDTTMRVTITAKIAVAHFDPQPLEEPLKRSLNNAIPSPYVFGGLDQSQPFQYSLKQFDTPKKTAQFAITAVAWAIASPDSVPLVKEQFLGLRSSDVDTLAKNFKDVDTISVSISPFWMRSIPKRADRVTLNIIAPTE